METGKLKLALSAGALALSMALAGCGGSSSGGGPTGERNTPQPQPLMVAGITFTETPADGIDIAAGATRNRNGATLTCPGPADCKLRVDADGNATGTGGLTARRMSRSADDNREAVREGVAISEHTPAPAVAGITLAGLSVNRFGGDAQITLSGQPGKDFALDTRAPRITGWAEQAFSYTGTGATPPTEWVAVYTNKEKATDVPWVGADVSGTLGQVAGTAVNNTIPVETGLVTFVEFSDTQEIHEERFGGDFKLPDPNSQGNSDRSMPTGREKGTFYGVPGEFVCANEACKITRTETGQIRFAGGTLTFDPDENDETELGKLKAKYAAQDESYISFGYWVTEVTTDGTPKNDIETFTQVVFSNPDGTEEGDGLHETATAIHGSATYAGAAAGWYARFDGTNTFSGPFTATASLTANFAGPAIDAADQYKVKGMISNFRGTNVDSTWKLELEEVDGAVALASLRDFDGTTSGGGDKGEWRASFYGRDTAEGNRPTEVAGEFNGNFRNGQVAGAFGATHQ